MQQRFLGPEATEDGPLGEALESQAQAVERAMRGEPTEPEELAWPDDLGPVEGTLAWTPETGFVHEAALTSRAESSRPQRAPVGVPPLSSEPTGAPAYDALPLQVSSVDAEPLPLVYPADDGPGPPPTPSEIVREPRELTDEEIARVAGRLRTTVAPPMIDPRDPILLDTLAAGLYGRLRTQLRAELIEDRERAGMLTEFH
jgi:hypothetical protein